MNLSLSFDSIIAMAYSSSSNSSSSSSSSSNSSSSSSSSRLQTCINVIMFNHIAFPCTWLIIMGKTRN